MKNRVTVRVDSTCSMAEVVLDGEVVITGNFWDFHPGCHNILEYGDDWCTAYGLAYAICHQCDIPTSEVVTDRTWRYTR